MSGGGNRLDVGMLRYTDVAWMDDRTAPSVHVRHNLEGLSAVFPPAYLLSFVTDHDDEPLHRRTRSRRCTCAAAWAGARACASGARSSRTPTPRTSAHEIDIYKGLRDTLDSASASLLTMQASADNGPAWDVMQATAGDDGAAVISAYQTDDGVDRINVKPVGLESATTYSVQSVDTGLLGEATGADLMSAGIDILQSPNSAAHILIAAREELESRGRPSGKPSFRPVTGSIHLDVHDLVRDRTSCGSRSRTTKSASLPAVIDPFRLSSDEA